VKRLIVTDSTSDLSNEIIDEFKILVLPVKLILDGKSSSPAVKRGFPPISVIRA
ncbi:MAG: DegV family protein, partial [Desulfamplus sp.]|nr:DegV family protein [Desulfamplus sp.]